MTDKHRDPEYIRNAKVVRARVHQAWRHGQDVRCWRTGRILIPGRPFDVGHIDPDGGHSISNLAPETVKSNRSEGGRRGAAITNAARRAGRPVTPPRRRSSDGLAPW